MPGLTISEAAKAWNVHRDSVKRWIKSGTVEATKDNQGIWRIAEGQQPPPSAAQGQPQGSPGEGSSGAALVQPQDGPGAALAGHLAELTKALSEAKERMATAEKDLAVSRREVELLRERMGELREELAATKDDRVRLLALVETQTRALVDLRENPRETVASVGLVGLMRRWLFGTRGSVGPAQGDQGSAGGV
jgi:excisionase family DNA binding protein